MEPSKKTRTYTVRTASNPSENIEVKAEDVELEQIGNNENTYVYHYNFFTDEYTVASFPFNMVMYITSKS